MRLPFRPSRWFFACSLVLMLMAMGHRPPADDALPWAEAGLTAQEAAVHLLNRFAFGPRPGEVDRVVAMGPDAWLADQLRAAQLRADPPDDALAPHLAGFEALSLSTTDLFRRYPRGTLVRREAVEAGLLSREDFDRFSRAELRDTLAVFMAERGYRPHDEMLRQLYAQKILRARYAEYQLREVLVDFWFNHFNVSRQDGAARPYLLAYERDAIRPHVLGDFRTLLGATARHPAMLQYLDNAQSLAPDSVRTTADVRMNRRPVRQPTGEMMTAAKPKRRGLNENYARELLELHTLGVDGGYTQSDVTEVARAFTGWGILSPLVKSSARDRLGRMTPAGFVVDDAFLFRAGAHDAEAKHLLGTDFPPGGGVDEGERVLDLLAAHPSTARHLARKLAVRFVSDDPPEALVEDLAAVYARTGGDLAAVLRALAASPHFWEEAARGAKVKSPFELAISALRAVDAEVEDARALATWLRRMGQPLYAYAAPTGYPDRADAWINTGTLLYRMNFAMRLATGKIIGVRLDLGALDEGREPASIEDALATYAALLLPTHDADALATQLLPLATDREVARRLDARAPAPDDAPTTVGAPTLGRAVGVLLGSPAFQRR